MAAVTARHRNRTLVLAFASILIVIGLFLVGYAAVHQFHAPAQPAATQSIATPTSTTPHPGLAVSQPVSLSIPSINVSSPLIQTGLNPDGTPAVPTGVNVDKPSWLTTSATPGATGTSIILGHVDTIKSGPSIFYNLGSLKQGDKVYVARADGTTATFTVTSVQSYPKDSFPSGTVYGKVNRPVLRLITCGGSWDSSSRRYTENIVAFTELTGAQH